MQLRPSFSTGYAWAPSMSVDPQGWKGLVGAWCPFLGKQRGTLYDISAGRKNHATINGTPWVLGPDGGPAINLNGSSQTIDVPSSNSLNFGTGNFSGGMWIRLTVDQIQILMSKRIVFANVGWVLYLVNRRLRFAIDDSGPGAAIDVTQSTTVLSLNVWYFVFFTADRSGLLTFYVNGLPAGGGGDISAENGDISNTHNFRIGSYADNTYWLGADVESASLYNRIVPPSEVSRLFFSHYATFEQASPSRYYSIPTITPPADEELDLFNPQVKNLKQSGRIENLKEAARIKNLKQSGQIQWVQ